ncbi:hypothetical protein, partial [Streptococcus suis]|uniref:hypothetical protein n=1 Tax=Streptococcus suis TaxID=1307 RepID=UPI001ABE6CA1|nr:hypothetical protein [Streptococcus suis]
VRYFGYKNHICVDRKSKLIKIYDENYFGSPKNTLETNHFQGHKIVNRNLSTRLLGVNSEKL